MVFPTRPTVAAHAALANKACLYCARLLLRRILQELAARLQRIENALSGISLDAENGKMRADNEAKSHLELAGRLGALESKVVTDSKKAAEAELQYRNVAREGFQVVKQGGGSAASTGAATTNTASSGEE